MERVEHNRKEEASKGCKIRVAYEAGPSGFWLYDRLMEKHCGGSHACPYLDRLLNKLETAEVPVHPHPLLITSIHRRDAENAENTQRTFLSSSAISQRTPRLRGERIPAEHAELRAA